MIAGHPVSIPVWMHKRLPAHSLCLSHPRDEHGRKRCLAIPPAEAPQHLAELARFVAGPIAASLAAHAAIEAARPLPRGKGPKRVRPAIAASRLHRHRIGSPCLAPIDVPQETGWFACRSGGSYGYEPVNGYVHVHRTRRGRAFLVRHLQGESSCPATIARKAAIEAAAKAAEAAA